MEDDTSEEGVYEEDVKEDVLCVDVQQLIDQFQDALKVINIQKVDKTKLPEKTTAMRKAISLCEMPTDDIDKPLYHSSEETLLLKFEPSNDLIEILKIVEFLETPKVSYNKTAMLQPVIVTPEDVQECTICACSLEGRSIKKEWVEQQLLFGNWQRQNEHECSMYSLKSFASSNSSVCSNNNSIGCSSNCDSSKCTWSQNRLIFSDDELENMQSD